MRLTIIGCGDAFGSGGRGNTCFLVDAGDTRLALDFGATALVEMKRKGYGPNDLDAIVLTHLHGDHFGGVPFLLLDCQFDSRRERPLTIIGPVGTRDRIWAAQEIFFPGTSKIAWRFELRIEELPCGARHAFRDLDMVSREVVHPSGAPATGVRLSHGGRVLAYSGDTSWTDTLIELARGADLFVVDCHDARDIHAPHLDFATLAANRDRLDARRIMVTHMGGAMIERVDEARRLGFLIADDGMSLDV